MVTLNNYKSMFNYYKVGFLYFTSAIIKAKAHNKCVIYYLLI